MGDRVYLTIRLHGHIETTCNYAEINDAESNLQALGIAYAVSHEEGGGFAAGCRSWSSEHGMSESTRAQGSGPVIETTSVEAALKTETPLIEIQKLIEIANRADGADLPTFTVSQDVHNYLFCQKHSS